MKLNKVDKGFYSMWHKTEKILDAKYDGACYKISDKKGKNGKTKMVKSDTKFWHAGRPPKWIKNAAFYLNGGK